VRKRNAIPNNPGAFACLRGAVALAAFMAMGIAGLASAANMPFWGARESMPADTPIDSLKKGEFIFLGDGTRKGPLLMIVSLDEQRAFVYRNGVLAGVSTVSTGKKGHETPTGVFTILQKNKDHFSNIYDNAPMPYMQRLTWGGIALHAGGLPGYPASHGCIRLPSEFARRLFEVTATGMTVVVASSTSEMSDAAYPGFLAPRDPAGQPLSSLPLMPSESLRWQPELAPEGPLSAVLSRQSGRVVVYRAGIEIGRARVVFSGSEPIGTHVLLMVEGAAQTAQRYNPSRQTQRWIEVDIAGHRGRAGNEPDPSLAARIEVPPEFISRMSQIIGPGATVLVTDEAVTAATTGPRLDVINTDPPESETETATPPPTP
jgi:L,D-transpeptidase catalytic domain